MNARRRPLLAHIERAFAGVELGDGVSLHETQVIDDYGTAAERRDARASDEKTDWQKLVDHPDLTVYFSVGYGGMSFLDAAGVRFHLPACLYRAVRDIGDDRVGNMSESLFYLLTSQDEYTLDRLAILNDAQRACVREVLVHFRDVQGVTDYELGQAINGFWSRPAGE